MIRLNLHIKSMERIGKQVSSMDISLMPLTALGVIAGADQSAFELVRLLAAAYRRGWYSQNDRRPVFTFMLLLLADSLDETMPAQSRQFLDTSPLADLLSAWNSPDVLAIAPLCIAACDFHTTRCDHRRDDDFSDGNWCYTPIEIMLLFRLRALRGLANPTLDHPIWNEGFANTEGEVTGLHDNLIQRARERMGADGYDEAVITRGTLTA
jgi:hypothetical protein